MKINRRDFGRLSAMALAASQLPVRADAQNTAVRPIGFAPVGLGTISDIFMRGCAGTGTAKTTALVTGHPVEKGAKYSAMYNVPKTSIYTYETYGKIRDDKGIDAVYIGLPNSMHCKYTVRAAEAGKHVLCEKPMAISSAECRKMIDACQHANVKLMIAYRIQYEPVWAKLKQRVSSGEIGKVKSFSGGFYGYQAAGAWRLNRALAGGGSLMDLGIYPLNAIRYITGEEPTIVTAAPSTPDANDSRFTQMEETIEWTMRFPSGAIASCGSSYGQRGPNALTVVGEKGTLAMQPAFNYDGIRLHGETPAGGAVNGWTISGITLWQKGPSVLPSINIQYDPASLPASPNQYSLSTSTRGVGGSTFYGTNAGITTGRPQLTCDPKSGLVKYHLYRPCFTAAPFGSPGGLGLPFIAGQAFMENDLAIYKTFTVREKNKVQFRASAFNWLNHPLPTFGGGESTTEYYFYNYTTHAITVNDTCTGVAVGSCNPGNPVVASNSYGNANGKPNDLFGTMHFKTAFAPNNQRIMEFDVKYTF